MYSEMAQLELLYIFTLMGVVQPTKKKGLEMCLETTVGG